MKELDDRRAGLLGHLIELQEVRERIVNELREAEASEAEVRARIDELDRMVVLLREQRPGEPRKPRRAKRKLPELVLQLVRGADSGISMRDLVAAADAKPGRVGQIVEDLSRENLVRRVVNPRGGEKIELTTPFLGGNQKSPVD